MEQDILSKDHLIIIGAFKKLDEISDSINHIVRGCRPLFKGDIYITDFELSKKLKISRRTLQDLRTNGIVPYYYFGGKVLYKESEIVVLLESKYIPAFSNGN